jgi:membrane-associated phospholipid phosphatase
MTCHLDGEQGLDAAVAMTFQGFQNPMHTFWMDASALGSSKLLIPAAVVTAGVGRMQTAGRAWLIGIAVMSTIVLASKIAFFGWGIGLRAVDFTGFSGHTAIAAAVYPVIMAALAHHHGPRVRRMAVCTGILIAGTIGIARVQLNAHSISEVLTGGLLGLAVSVFIVQRWHETLIVSYAAVALAFAISWTMGRLWLSDVRTESLIIHTALSLSHREVPYHRHHSSPRRAQTNVPEA